MECPIKVLCFACAGKGVFQASHAFWILLLCRFDRNDHSMQAELSFSNKTCIPAMQRVLNVWEGSHSFTGDLPIVRKGCSKRKGARRRLKIAFSTKTYVCIVPVQRLLQQYMFRIKFYTWIATLLGVFGGPNSEVICCFKEFSHRAIVKTAAQAIRTCINISWNPQPLKTPCSRNVPQCNCCSRWCLEPQGPFEDDWEGLRVARAPYAYIYIYIFMYIYIYIP